MRSHHSEFSMPWQNRSITIDFLWFPTSRRSLKAFPANHLWHHEKILYTPNIREWERELGVSVHHASTCIPVGRCRIVEYIKRSRGFSFGDFFGMQASKMADKRSGQVQRRHREGGDRVSITAWRVMVLMGRGWRMIDGWEGRYCSPVRPAPTYSHLWDRDRPNVPNTLSHIIQQ